MENFIIDTNFFVNLEIKSGLGKNPKEIVINFTHLARRLKKEKLAEFFMPPRIIEEFLQFFEKKDFVDDFLSLITIKSPEVDKIQFSARVFYQLIDEVRKRAYRGLTIGEESVVNGARKMLGLTKNKLNKVEFEKTIGETIRNLRERYRQATRFGFLDSVADLDLIVLTKELNGFLISSDEGVIRWGRIFGVKELPPSLFQSRLMSLLSR